MQKLVTDYEKKVNAYFPQEFKAFLKKINSDTIYFRLPDQKFKLLPFFIGQLSKDDEFNPFTVQDNIINHCKHGVNNSVVLPFARSIIGDKLIYLFFEAEKGKESAGEVFIANIDSSDSPLLLSSKMDFLLGQVAQTKFESVINFKNYNFQECLDNFTLIQDVSRWDNEEPVWFQIFKSNKIEKSIKFELGAKIVDSGIANYYLSILISNGSDVLSLSATYFVTPNGISKYIFHKPRSNQYNDIGYTIKIRCLIDLIKTFIKENEEYSVTVKKELANISICKLADMDFKQIDYA